MMFTGVRKAPLFSATWRAGLLWGALPRRKILASFRRRAQLSLWPCFLVPLRPWSCCTFAVSSDRCASQTTKHRGIYAHVPTLNYCSVPCYWNPRTCFCCSHSSGNLDMRVSLAAVRSGGWHPSRMARVISGLRKESLTIRVT